MAGSQSSSQRLIWSISKRAEDCARRAGQDVLRPALGTTGLGVLDLQAEHLPVAAQIGEAECVPFVVGYTLSVHGAVNREPAAISGAGVR